MKKLITLIIFCFVSFSFAGWDNTLPKDTTPFDDAMGYIRDNWDAMEVVFGVDLSSPSPIGKEVAFYSTTSFAAAITEISTDEVTLIINEEEAVAADVTVPTNVSLFFAKGGSLAVTSTNTVIINGDIIAGSYQIFSGAGDVTFGTDAPGRINAKWFGVTGDGSTDETDAFQVWLNRSILSDKDSYLPAGTYCLEDQVLYAFNATTHQKVVILGDEKRTIILDKNSTGSCLRFTRGGSAHTAQFVLSGLEFRINADKQDYSVIEFVDMATAHFSIRNCFFNGDDKKYKYFIYMEDLWEGSIRDCVFRDSAGGVNIYYDEPAASGGNVHFDRISSIDGGPIVLLGGYTNHNFKFTNCKFVQTTSNYYDLDDTTGACTAGQKTVTITSTTGYTAGDMVFLSGWVTGDSKNKAEINFIDEVTNSTTLTMRYAFKKSYDSGIHLLHAPMNLVGMFLGCVGSVDTCHFETYGVPIVLNNTRGWDIKNCALSYFDQGIMLFSKAEYINVEQIKIYGEQSGAYIVYCCDLTNASEPLPKYITVGPKNWCYEDEYIDDQLLYTEFTIPSLYKNRYEIITRDGVSTNRESLLSVVTGVDLAGTSDTETILYTVPVGFTFVPTKVILRDFSADEHGTPPIITLGTGDTTAEDFLGDQTLSNITANYAREVIVLRPLPNATPVTSDSIVAAGTFVLEITQANGATLTCTADVWGYLY